MTPACPTWDYQPLPNDWAVYEGFKTHQIQIGGFLTKPKHLGSYVAVILRPQPTNPHQPVDEVESLTFQNVVMTLKPKEATGNLEISVFKLQNVNASGEIMDGAPQK